MTHLAINFLPVAPALKQTVTGGETTENNTNTGQTSVDISKSQFDFC